MSSLEYCTRFLRSLHLYNKINNITCITNLLLFYILVKILFIKQILFYYIIKSIIYISIITYNSSKLIKNIVILKNKKKNYKLIISTIIFYYIKSNKSLNILFLKIIHIIYNNFK